jgi:capsular exopolysaccharide synthesis family protein
MALWLDVRELGVIPDGLEAPESRMTPAVGAPAPVRRVELVSSQMPRSLPAECIRSVRTALLGGGDTAEPPRTIVVTSAAAGEGKTTVAANLAISLTEVDRRVLLIDADLRRPRLHRVFGIDNRLGLSDLLNESGVQARLDQALVPVEGVAGLWLLPSGVSAYGGPGLLHSAQARELLNRLGERFDRVVIDAPPAAAVSDARALARWADGALLVARAASVDLREVADTVTLLRADGAVILGAVLNRWDPKRLGYRRYGPYAAYSPGAGRAKRAAAA